MLDDDSDEAGRSVASSSSDQNSDFFAVKRVSLVATWSWNLGPIDTCAICRYHIMESCIECQANPQSEGCSVVRGTCQHAFHDHCIVRWLQTRKTCPLDNKTWEYQKYGQKPT